MEKYKNGTQFRNNSGILVFLMQIFLPLSANLVVPL